jgi:hypothetical protein
LVEFSPEFARMTTALPRRIALVATWLMALCFLLQPVAGRASDTSEIKANVSNLLNQVQNLQAQVIEMNTSLGTVTNSFRNDLSAIANNVASLKTAVESANKPGSGNDATSAPQFAQSLHDLSNSVSSLNAMLATLKTNSGKPDYKAEVEQQLAGLNSQLTTLSNALATVKPVSLDTESRESLDVIKSKLASAAPAWMNYTVLGGVGVSLGLSALLLVLVRGQAANTEKKAREGRDVLVRFASQMDGRVKTMEGSGVAVQNSAREIGEFLTRVETTVHAQLEMIAEQLNSTKAAEFAIEAARAAEEMTLLRRESAGQLEQLRAEAARHISELRTQSAGELGELRAGTAELQNFMGDLQKTTERWVADFEKQTGRTLDKIKDDMHALQNPFWPFPDGGKLEQARENLWERANTGDKAAHALLVELGNLQVALDEVRGSDVTHVVEALECLGVRAYRFWKREPDATVESTFEQAQTWGEEINRLLTESKVPLSVRIIMPRASFDMATMLSEHSATGTTTRVREPLSWAVMSHGHEQAPKVLATG